MKSSFAPVKLSHVAHPLRLAIFVFTIIVLLAGSFVAGGFVRSPETEAISNSNDKIVVTAEVEDRVVNQQVQLFGTVVSGSQFSVTVPESLAKLPETPTASEVSSEEPSDGSLDKETVQPSLTTPSFVPETAKTVLTAAHIAPGQNLSSGQLIAEISGRPLIALTNAVPLYRDLVIGSVGHDVSALQSELASLGYADVEASGVLDWVTLHAVQSMYASISVTPPMVATKTQGVAFREFALIPAGTHPVVAVAPVGAVLSPDTPVVSVQTSPAVIMARATLTQADQLAPGQSIRARVGSDGEEFDTNIVTVSEFRTADDVNHAGKDIVAALPVETASIIASGVTVSFTSNTNVASTPAVPLAAIRQDSTGSYVLLETKRIEGATPEAERKAYVTVTAQADGWVAITANPSIEVGTPIVITP